MDIRNLELQVLWKDKGTKHNVLSIDFLNRKVELEYVEELEDTPYLDFSDVELFYVNVDNELFKLLLNRRKDEKYRQ